MDLDAADIVGIADRIGIVAFAISGVELGLRKRLDLFGLIVMGVVTATGGGLMRDVILGRMPFVLEREDYLLLAVGAALLSIPLLARERPAMHWMLAIADALGLGAFAVAGSLAAIGAGLPFPAVIVMAILTAAGGGVLRDVLAARVPLALRSEVNATAAGLGAIAIWAIEPLNSGAAALIGAAVTASVRFVSVAFNIHLPTPGHRRIRARR